MDRRAFIKAAAGVLGSGALATPAIAQRGAARVLRFVPQADLANFDPIWNTQYVVRNAAALVWDTLYGFDDKLQPRRQMVESEETSSDGLVWTFRLRPGLKFHDGERVLAKDVVKIHSAQTVEGHSITIKTMNGGVMVDGAHVTKTDIVTSNGVIHVIDSVLLPK